MPRFLYKYRSIAGESREFLKRLIAERELYFSHARKFNDPFDCAPVPELKCSDKVFENYLDGFFERNFPLTSRKEKKRSIAEIIRDPQRNQHSKAALNNLKLGLESALDLAGVFCLSEDPANILMWSHYADSHRGVCLEFEVVENDRFFSEAQVVRYSDERPIVNLILESPENVCRKSLLTKAAIWKYEREWRMVDPSRKEGVHRFPKGALKRIIFGVSSADSDRSEISGFIKEHAPGVTLAQASMKSRSFEIQIS